MHIQHVGVDERIYRRAVCLDLRISSCEPVTHRLYLEDVDESQEIQRKEQHHQHGCTHHQPRRQRYSTRRRRAATEDSRPFAHRTRFRLHV